jgi:LytS/YehU family sensor histidine kinase
VALGRRFRPEPGRWAGPLAVHAAASVAITGAVIAITELALSAFLHERSSPPLASMAFSLRVNFHGLFPTYWAVLGGFFLFDYYARYRDRELRAAQLEARLAETRLQALRMQLQPHFLFNTLHSISSLMYTDVDAAEEMVTRLGDFLRLTLESAGAAEVPLRTELEFSRRYLEIERTRFEERLQVRFAVAEECLSSLVPTLILQPLVENAIRHGIDRRREGGTVEVAAFRADGTLVLRVANDGASDAAEAEGARAPVGLANTRERLRGLYGPGGDLRLEHRPDGGAVATVVLPFRQEAA